MIWYMLLGTLACWAYWRCLLKREGLEYGVLKSLALVETAERVLFGLGLIVTPLLWPVWLVIMFFTFDPIWEEMKDDN